MKKSVWKGTLSFGLVNIQVELYSAIEPQSSLGFKMLHSKECQSPVKYQRSCSECNKEVEWSDIIKGIKLSSGQYLTMTPENLKAMRPKKSENIIIKEFVDEADLKPIHYDNHYYVAPTKATERAFYLFSEALNKLKKVAIGQFIMKDKEYLVAIQPYKGGLLLSTLNYQKEIRESEKLEEIKANKPKLDDKELELAIELINKLEEKTFDASKYQDSFQEHIKKQIQLAEEGKKLQPEIEAPKVARSAQSLIDSLKASLDEPVEEDKKVKVAKK